MTNAERRDPFEDLAQPITPQAPRPSFARELRSRVVVALGLDEAVPIVTLPERKPMTATTTSPSTSTVSPTAPVPSVVTASEERCVGKECVSTCSFRVDPYTETK